MTATIKDIQKETGLALSTISKYINGGNVRPENKQKIDEAVRKLKYRPNEIARGLITKKTRTIGFAVHDISGAFGGLLAHYIGAALRNRGYGMLICDSNNSSETEARNIRFLTDKQVDGILVFPVSEDRKFLDPAVQAGIPVVTLDRPIAGGLFDCVTIDNTAAAEFAVSYLIERNHRKIAAIFSDEYTGRERVAGYRQAMNSAGIVIPPEYEFHGKSFSVELGYTGMKNLLGLSERPTAVLACNYEVVLGVVMALNESGVSCPDEISVMGFDALVLNMVMKPDLTLMSQPMEKIASESVRILLERIDEKEQAAVQKILLYATLREGSSVRRL